MGSIERHTFLVSASALVTAAAFSMISFSIAAASFSVSFVAASSVAAASLAAAEATFLASTVKQRGELLVHERSINQYRWKRRKWTENEDERELGVIDERTLSSFSVSISCSLSSILLSQRSVLRSLSLDLLCVPRSGDSLSFCCRSGRSGGVGHRFQTRFLVENEGERVENEERRKESWESWESWESRRTLSARGERSQKEMERKRNEGEILIRNARVFP
jgi:hypothetical protein